MERRRSQKLAGSKKENRNFRQTIGLEEYAIQRMQMPVSCLSHTDTLHTFEEGSKIRAAKPEIGWKTKRTNKKKEKGVRCEGVGPPSACGVSLDISFHLFSAEPVDLPACSCCAGEGLGSFHRLSTCTRISCDGLTTRLPGWTGTSSTKLKIPQLRAPRAQLRQSGGCR